MGRAVIHQRNAHALACAQGLSVEGEGQNAATDLVGVFNLIS